MNVERRQIELLEALVQDEELERLEALARKFNVFEVLGAVRQEIRHSNFLAWLLDPSGNHKLGDYFAKLFLWKTTSLAKALCIDSLSAIDTDALDLKKMEVRREWRAIDILLVAKDQGFVCAIENKIDSWELGDQLARYRRTCVTEFPGCIHHLVFLSPTGAPPSQQDWVPVDYGIVADMIDRTLQVRAKSTGEGVDVFLRHYASMLRRHVVGGSELQELCQKIYSKHRQALDLLFEHRPDTQAEIRLILEAIISKDPDFEFDQNSGKTYVNFFPRSWTPPVRTAGKFGWILKLMFLNRPDSLTLYLEIMPGEAAVRAGIYEAAQGSSVFSVPAKLAPEWCRVFRRDFLGAADFEQAPEWIEEQIRQKMESFKKNDFPLIDEVIRRIEFC